MLCTYVGARQAEESIEPLGNGFTDGYKVSYVGSWNTTLVLCMRSQCVFLPPSHLSSSKNCYTE